MSNKLSYKIHEDDGVLSIQWSNTEGFSGMRTKGIHNKEFSIFSDDGSPTLGWNGKPETKLLIIIPSEKKWNQKIHDHIKPQFPRHTKRLIVKAIREWYKRNKEVVDAGVPT